MKLVSSVSNSAMSDLSSKGSLLDSITSFNFNNKHEMKRSNNSVQFRKVVKSTNVSSIKKESQQEVELSSLRRKVCRKVFNIIHKEFQRPKVLAKRLTLAIEYRINKMSPHHSK